MDVSCQAQGDADGNGAVDGNDFLLWQAGFGGNGGRSGAGVPEPTTVVLAVIGIALLGLRGRRADLFPRLR